jgi:hypothetical protein
MEVCLVAGQVFRSSCQHLIFADAHFLFQLAFSSGAFECGLNHDIPILMDFNLIRVVHAPNLIFQK